MIDLMRQFESLKSGSSNVLKMILVNIFLSILISHRNRINIENETKKRILTNHSQLVQSTDWMHLIVRLMKLRFLLMKKQQVLQQLKRSVSQIIFKKKNSRKLMSSYLPCINAMRENQDKLNWLPIENSHGVDSFYFYRMKVINFLLYITGS